MIKTKTIFVCSKHTVSCHFWWTDSIRVQKNAHPSVGVTAPLVCHWTFISRLLWKDCIIRT